MSHLAEVYAKDLGVKIGEPIFKPHFYPITEDSYITIHTDKKVPSKHYDYWEEVIILVKTKFPDIKFIQIGNGSEPPIKNADQFIKTESVKQCAYIIKNCKVHVGIDSLPIHIASSFNKKIVGIYSHTYASTCSPIWGDQNNFTIIESHRNGDKPSFSDKEKLKTINLIKPEEVANSVLKHLGGEETTRKTLFIGDRYKETYIHLIPDHKYDLKGKNIIIRFDLLHKEENVSHLFKNNNCFILTKDKISQDLLNEGGIKSITYFSSDFDEEFVSQVKQKGMDLILYCDKKENLSEMRLKFFDNKVFSYDKEEKIKSPKKKVDLKNKFKLKSYALYMKNGEAYGSLYEAQGKNNLDEIYLDLEYLMIYLDGDE
jgi:hypothetical protein